MLSIRHFQVGQRTLTQAQNSKRKSQNFCVAKRQGGIYGSFFEEFFKEKAESYSCHFTIITLWVDPLLDPLVQTP
jgi:hypothetical protein